MILGKHLLIECSGEHAHMDSDELESLMTRAADSAGATVLYSYFHKFGGHAGITGVLVLAESHITVHTWPERHYAAFDIFMCGNARPFDAAEVLVSAYPDAKVSIQSVDRGDDFNNKSNGIEVRIPSGNLAAVERYSDGLVISQSKTIN